MILSDKFLWSEEDLIFVGKNNVFKHLAGQHDQESHGSWAGETAGELTDDEIRELIYNTDSVEHAFQKIAKRLGKNMKPRVEKVSADGTEFYRGVSDKTRDAQRLLDGEIRYTEEQTYGQGIYLTPNKDIASNYGTLIRLKIDPSAKILKGEAEWENSFKVKINPDGKTKIGIESDFLDFDQIKMENYSISDVRNLYLASKGYDGIQIYSEILLFNGDKLTVNEKDIGKAVRKHQAGQHDQSTHGSWAGANGYKLASLDDLPALDSYISPAVRQAKDMYVGKGYEWMNAYLRDGYIEETITIERENSYIELSQEKAIAQIDSLKSALYETRTTQDLTVTRWTRTGESIIGEKFSETSNFESLIGKTYHAKGFTSTSAKPHESVNDSYKSQSKVLVNIHMPAGTYGATVGNDRESEFILAPDTFFVVMGVNDIGEGRISLDLLVTGQGNG